MAQATLFTFKDEVFATISIEELLHTTKVIKYPSGYNMIRSLVADGATEELKGYLNSLRRFTIDGNILPIEIAEIAPQNREQTQLALTSLPYVYAFFKNAFDTGYIILAQVDDELKEQGFDDLVKNIEETTGATIDRATIGAKIYASYDPDLYINENCKVFKVCKPAKEEAPSSSMLEMLADIVSIPTRVPLASKEDETIEKTAVIELDDEIAEMQGSPRIPETVFEKLPYLLKEACSVFKDPVERDIFLTGAICVLSGCLDLFLGKYDQRLVYSNLFCFPFAPAGSGKGVLYYCKKLAMEIHNKLKSDKTGPKKMLYFPANISASALIMRLNDNDEKGIILETEADTLNYTLKKQWGNFSDILRNSFHHEPVTISRKTSDQNDELDFPRLSIILSGTPMQVRRLIPSPEDGLFSRFIFYSGDGISEWKDLSPNEDVDVETHFDKLSKKVLDIYDFYKQYSKEFHFTKAQWSRHTEVFRKVHIDLTHFINQDLNATVKRIGLIQYRIAMILTAIRIAGLNSTDEKVYCDDTDFDTATQMALTYLEHAKCLFQVLPLTPKTNIEPNKKLLYDALPAIEFGRKDAIAIAQKLGFQTRSADGYLSELYNGKLLKKAGFGRYKKA